ncbi:ATP phosphoribosyltransferase regulatory subunit [Clostridia bacterium]|nr:ATP phosphoribosyltransferase regulatory subunit [Clostridia bacterium]
MSKIFTAIPPGTTDIVFDSALYIRRAIDGFTKVYESEGFREIITPSIEYYSAFDFDNQPVHEETMYKFQDCSGKMLVLRPDCTTPVSRVAATKFKCAVGSVKFYYNGNVFRSGSGYSGKMGEIIQSGAEIIGTGGKRADLIYIDAALKTLESTGLDYKLEIGHIGFYTAIAGKDPEAIGKVSRLFGGGEVFAEAQALAEGNEKAESVLDYLSDLYDTLSESGYADRIIIDLGIVHELDYYTGIVIGGYVEGIGESVLSGGRYDNLTANFGKSSPAAGFAINVNLIAKALEAKEKLSYAAPDEIVFFAENDFKKALMYKNSHPDKRIELSPYDNHDETKAYARERCIPTVTDISGRDA